ncbi:MAG: hypothetical protein WD042_11640 [Phycisphaeraceae bacterium]
MTRLADNSGPTAAPAARPSHGAAAPGAGAFTIVELLVVISIIALLIAVMLPALVNARQAALATVCQTKLRQIHMASCSYGADLRLIPAGLSFRNEFVAGPGHAKSWYFSVSREWTTSGSYAADNMKAGYLPFDKMLAWCPSKDRQEVENPGFWTLDITDHLWNQYAVYGVNGLCFNSTPSIGRPFPQYYSNGFIPLAKWEMFNKPFYMTETSEFSRATTKSDLDPPRDAIGNLLRPARHQGSLNVSYVDGHVNLMPYEELGTRFDSGDPSFLWGD